MNLPRGTQIIPHDISKRMADRASSTTVNVINQSGGEVETTKRRGPDGGEVIDVHIKRRLAGGAYDKSMARFGATPQG